MKPLLWLLLAFLLFICAADVLFVLLRPPSPSRSIEWTLRELRVGPREGETTARPASWGEALVMVRSGELPREALDEAAHGLLLLDLSEGLGQTGGSPSGPVGWVESFRREGLLSPATWEAYLARLLDYLRLPECVDGALSRLSMHLQGGDMPNSIADRFTQALLDRLLRGERSSRNWDPRSEALMQSLRAAVERGLLQKGSWEKALRAVTRVELKVRPLVRYGDKVPFRVRITNGRLDGAGYTWTDRIEEIRIDGDRVPENAASGWSSEPRRPSGGTLLLDPRSSVEAGTLEEGRHEIALLVSIDVRPSGKDAERLPRFWWTENVSSSFRVLEEGADSVELVVDPGLREDVPVALGFPSVTFWAREGRWSLETEIGLGCPPVGLSFDLFWKTPSGELRLGKVWQPPCDLPLGKTNRRFRKLYATHSEDAIDPAWFQLGEIELIFRPDSDLARLEVEGLRIWGEPVTIAGVPLEMDERGASRGRRTR